ncbi:MAG TPA: hypothetical protein VM513_29220 [Kofleriaceae bacterium]|jgi:hypothetical protein|nr:hypothetical protein [Kofleriaceae bacterium]
MAIRSLTRWGRLAAGATSVAGGVVFGALFSSIAAGVVAALVIAVCIVDFARPAVAPLTDGPHTMTIDLSDRQ